jgi:hypothetical protein
MLVIFGVRWANFPNLAAGSCSTALTVRLHLMASSWSDSVRQRFFMKGLIALGFVISDVATGFVGHASAS